MLLLCLQQQLRFGDQSSLFTKDIVEHTHTQLIGSKKSSDGWLDS